MTAFSRRGLLAFPGGVLAARGSEVTYGQAPAKNRPLVERLSFFDADVLFGNPLPAPEEEPPQDSNLKSAKAVLQELDHYRIKEALVSHVACQTRQDASANESLGRALQHHPRLHVCWGIVPDAFGKIPTAKSLLQSIRASKGRAVRAFPFDHKYNLASLDGILGMLEEYRIPLIVDYGIVFPHHDRTDWAALALILKRYPALPVIQAHPPSLRNHRIFELLELSQQFHLNPAGFRIHQEILTITRLFGAQAVIFGSHLPYYTAAAPIAEVVYSELDEREQMAIAGGTLRRLLSEAKL